LKFSVAVPGLTTFPGLGGQPEWSTGITTSEIVAIAQAADELGYHYLVIPWHLVMRRGEWVRNMGARWPHSLAAAGFLLGATRRITVNPLVVVPCTQPVELAKAIATLDWMSGGRCLPVLLTGYLRWEFELLGVDFDTRDALMDEYCAALGELWEADSPAFDGATVQFSDIAFEPKPARQPLPVWFGGKASSTRALRRVARWGAGWMSYASRHDEHPGAIAFIRAQPEFVDAPRSLDVAAYFLEPTHDPVTHEQRQPPSPVLGVDAVLDRLHRLGELGVTVTQPALDAKCDRAGQPEPIPSATAYIERLHWFAEEIMPGVGGVPL
jgi:alkanesulfonate monooxygenase SsuD/methylene tetrahydromethanopterin reductase-like flavin-dependent oxidoreductase (luciferase family)